MVLNPIPVMLIIGWLALMVVLLWLDRRQLARRIRQLERVFELLRNPTMKDLRTIEVPAGTAIKAGEAIFIAADGKAYPCGLKEEKNDA